MIVLESCGYEPYKGNSTRHDEIIDYYVKTILLGFLQTLEEPKIMIWQIQCEIKAGISIYHLRFVRSKSVSPVKMKMLIPLIKPSPRSEIGRAHV